MSSRKRGIIYTILIILLFAFVSPFISANNNIWPVEEGDTLNYKIDWKVNEETQVKGNIIFKIEEIGIDQFGFKNAITYRIITDFIVDINNIESLFLDHQDSTGAFRFLRFKFWGIYLLYNSEGLEEARVYWQDWILEQIEIGIELENGFTGNYSDTGYSYRTFDEFKQFIYTDDGILTVYEYRFSTELRSTLMKLSLTTPTVISGYSPFWIIAIISIGLIFIIEKDRMKLI